jgi:hypothetical protein
MQISNLKSTALCNNISYLNSVVCICCCYYDASDVLLCILQIGVHSTQFISAKSVLLYLWQMGSLAV